MPILKLRMCIAECLQHPKTQMFAQPGLHFEQGGQSTCLSLTIMGVANPFQHNLVGIQADDVVAKNNSSVARTKTELLESSRPVDRVTKTPFLCLQLPEFPSSLCLVGSIAEPVQKLVHCLSIG